MFGSTYLFSLVTANCRGQGREIAAAISNTYIFIGDKQERAQRWWVSGAQE